MQQAVCQRCGVLALRVWGIRLLEPAVLVGRFSSFPCLRHGHSLFRPGDLDRNRALPAAECVGLPGDVIFIGTRSVFGSWEARFGGRQAIGNWGGSMLWLEIGIGEILVAFGLLDLQVVFREGS